MSNTFEVVFSGEVIEGNDVAATRAKIGKLFNADEAKIERLFSGSSVIIKKDLDEATANKYIGAFKNAGARAVVRNTAASIEATPAAAPVSTAPSAPTTPSTSGSTFEHSQEASKHLTEAPKTQLDLNSDPDLSGLSLRENTGNLVDSAGDVADANIDTSEFSLAATGSDLADKKEEVAPLNADLSGISLVDD